jgi:hypothetical protein
VSNIAIQKAGQMPPPLKAAVEQILGRSIDPSEEISVIAVPPQQVAPCEGGASIVERIERLLNIRAAKVSGIPDHEIDSLIDQTVYDARHHRR